MTNFTPELPIGIQNVEGAPVSIAGASIATVKFDRLSPAQAGSEGESWYRICLTVHVLNNDDRVVTGFALRTVGLKQSGLARVVKVFDSLPKGSRYTSRNLIGDGIVSSADADGVTVKIVGVRFEDGSSWGSIPPAPNPSDPQSRAPGDSAGPDGTPPSGAAPSPQPQEPASGSAAPAPSPTPFPQIIRKSGGVLHSTAINRALPTYPEAAKAAGISGGVTVEILIDEQGNVEKATAVSGPEALREAAEAAARQWRWNPTTLSGAPVRVTGTLTFGFALTGR